VTREEAHRILDAVLDINDMYGRYKVLLEFGQYDFCDEQYIMLAVFDTIGDGAKVVDMCNVQEGANTADDALTIIKKWRDENDAV
jgi:hypothetical protein